MIPGSDNISPQANSPLGGNHGGNDNRDHVSSLLTTKYINNIIALTLCYIEPEYSHSNFSDRHQML